MHTRWYVYIEWYVTTKLFGELDYLSNGNFQRESVHKKWHFYTSTIRQVGFISKNMEFDWIRAERK